MVRPYLAVPGSNMGATKMADLKVNGLGWGIGCRFDCNRAKEWGFLEGVLTEYHFFSLSWNWKRNVPAWGLILSSF